MYVMEKVNKKLFQSIKVIHKIGADKPWVSDI
jgi:hypothetical protein